MFFKCDSTIVKMRDSRCHFNASNFWKNYTDKNGDESAYICTGWAMSNDNIWRQHSWVCLRDSDSIIETTEDREIYYGFILNYEECNKFYWDNY